MSPVAESAGAGSAGATRAAPPAGPELDARLHRLLAGEETRGSEAAPPYSTDLAAAWSVVDRLLRTRRWVEVVGTGDGEWICQVQDPGHWDSEWLGTVRGEARTAPLAICRAALRVLDRAP